MLPTQRSLRRRMVSLADEDFTAEDRIRLAKAAEKKHNEKVRAFEPPKDQRYSWKEVDNWVAWHKIQSKRKGASWDQHRATGDAWSALKAHMLNERDPVQDARKAAKRADNNYQHADRSDPRRAELLREKQRLNEQYSHLRGTSD